MERRKGERRRVPRSGLELWRLGMLALGVTLIGTVAYGTLQTTRLVQEERDASKRGQAVIAEAFARLARIDKAVSEEFQDHRKRGESSTRCLVETMGLLHNQPPMDTSDLIKVYNECVVRISGGTPPPEGVEDE